VKKVGKVPAWYCREILFRVVAAIQLHTHHGEYEDDDGKNDAQVAESSHRPAYDADEQVQRRPRLG